jgi:hypothetical protein
MTKVTAMIWPASWIRPRGREQPVADLAIDEQLCTVETGPSDRR